jgi:1-phosphatidylinositol-3-phosphate 5-kinase
VGEILPQSLAATQDWAVDGGKSKSSFWKTKDNRFIIKTLVNSWNVTDLYVN